MKIHIIYLTNLLFAHGVQSKLLKIGDEMYLTHEDGTPIVQIQESCGDLATVLRYLGL